MGTGTFINLGQYVYFQEQKTVSTVAGSHIRWQKCLCDKLLLEVYKKFIDELFAVKFLEKILYDRVGGFMNTLTLINIPIKI